VQDHVVRYEVDEDRRPDGDGVVAAVLVLGHLGQPAEALAAVDGEAPHLLAELGTVAHVVLGRVAVGERPGNTSVSSGWMAAQW
jgi:hypothetical protein